MRKQQSRDGSASDDEPASINELESDLFNGAAGADDAIDPATDARKARKKAMDLLARREYGFAELVGRLGGAGFARDTAEDVVAVLADEGLQDDSRFAASFLTAKSGRGTGPLRIRQALKEKGLSARTVDLAFDGDDTDWHQRAREVRVKKFGAEVPADFAGKAKQMRFLNYRGFDRDHIDAAFDAAADDVGEF